MGSNMQRQAVPLEMPEEAFIQTGMDEKVAQDSMSAVKARRSGEVVYVDANSIKIKTLSGIDTYDLTKFNRSNQRTCINQRPIVTREEKVTEGDFIADGPAIRNGKLALGRDILVAFTPFGGYNFEDAVLISEKLVKDDIFTSIHIEEFHVEAKELKSGIEEITADIPNVEEVSLKNLDEDGIIRIGAEVKFGSIKLCQVVSIYS